MRSYPTDEELMEFVEQLEKEELYVPAHFKEEIFHKLSGEKAKVPLWPEEVKQSRRRRRGEYGKGIPKEKKKEFAIYAAKVIGGMAASFLLLLTLPHEEYGGSKAHSRGEITIGSLEKGFSRWNEKTDTILSEINKAANTIFTRERAGQ